MKKLIKGRSNYRAVFLVENFTDNHKKNVLWIYGKSGCGKTELINYLIQRFGDKNRNTCPLTAKEFLDLILQYIKQRQPFASLISYCQNYDLLVFDNIDLLLKEKPFTQREIKNLILEIIRNRKTKVVLITNSDPKTLRNLKFNKQSCNFIRLNTPDADFKIKLLEDWVFRSGVIIPKQIIVNIARATNNLFRLKGLFNQFQLKSILVDGK